MPRTCVTARQEDAPRPQDLPIFQGTTCQRCRADQGVAVRSHDTVLCLDCYRRATRAARARWRRLEALARGAAPADAEVVVNRLARLRVWRAAGAGERSPTMAWTG